MSANERTNLPESRRPRSPLARRAYVLIFVLGLATVVSSLGIAYIHANNTAMPAAMNRYYASRAQYLAESGFDLAKHYLLYPPSSVPFDGFWAGGNLISIDGGNDFTNVMVTKDPKHPLGYRVFSVGAANDSAGELRSKKGVQADVILPESNMWKFNYALLSSSAALSIPAAVTVRGNLHGNGSVTGMGNCTGDVSASLSATWPGGGPPTSVKSLQPTVTLPASTNSPYFTYTIRGKTYTAYEYTSNRMSASDALALNQIDMSATNPGRIIRTPNGNFRLQNGAQVDGTILVSGGNLEVELGIVVTARPNFPAVICTGNIEARGSGDGVSVTGAVICGGNITDKNNGNVVISVRGATVVGGSVIVNGKNSMAEFIWDADRSRFYNFETAGTREPATVLNWTEY
ncbi:MAG: hypothetical protein KF841_05795 [Phycisphaerae bacterium]|nr:hypothetical protein [Phycisphaerae bacterium]